MAEAHERGGRSLAPLTVTLQRHCYFGHGVLEPLLRASRDAGEVLEVRLGNVKCLVLRGVLRQVDNGRLPIVRISQLTTSRVHEPRDHIHSQLVSRIPDGDVVEIHLESFIGGHLSRAKALSTKKYISL